MNSFSAIIPVISASVLVLADNLVAVLLSWIDLSLYKTSRNAATHKVDAMLLELSFGLLTVAVMVLWLGIVLGIFFWNASERRLTYSDGQIYSPRHHSF
jgi:hypothetical protein